MLRFQKGAPAGLLVAATTIALGFALEGGRLGQVLQPTAAFIVLGGTLGAVLVHFPVSVVRRALEGLRDALLTGGPDAKGRMEQILHYATQARRQGIVSLDAELRKVSDPYFRKALMLAVDGIQGREIREILAMESLRLEEEDESAARVWESAGGFAPTIGILGAVLGLIQVMQHLDDVSEIGRGIAVAFVATLYGVGLANLFLLPMAGRLRGRALDALRLREATTEGVLGIVEGASTRMLRERMGATAGGRAPASVAQIEPSVAKRAAAR